MTIALAEADAARLDDVMVLMKAAFGSLYGEAWTRSQCAGILPMHGVKLVVADGAGEPLGFALYRSVVDDAELLLLAVSPDAQRKGIGRQLLNRFIEDAKKNGASRIHLEVREGNPAVQIYEAAGFKLAGRRRDYYSGADGKKHDALTFVLAA